MNIITYIPPAKPEGQARGCILRLSMVFNPLGDDSPARMWAIIPQLLLFRAWSENLAYSCSSNHR